MRISRAVGLLCLMAAAGLAVWMGFASAPSPFSRKPAEAAVRAERERQAGAADAAGNSAGGAPGVPAGNAAAEWPRWGGALNSAAREGAHFFDSARARRFAGGVPPELRKYVIELHARAFLPDPHARIEESVPAGGAKTIAYMQFLDNPTDAQRAELARAGVELLAYVQGYAWTVRAAPEALRAARELKCVRALAAVDARDKISPLVFEDRFPGYAQAPDGRARYALLALKGTQPAELDAAVQASPALAGAKVQWLAETSIGPKYEVTAARGASRSLAALGLAAYVEYVSPPAVSRDANVDAASNIGLVRDAAPNVQGSGVSVAVRELGRPVAHADFGSRLQYIETGDSNSGDADHATAVCGQIGSSGSQQPGAKGVAPAVSMFAYAVNSGGTAFSTTDVIDAANRGVRISNHSYGPSNPPAFGDYQTVSADWDNALRDKNVTGAFANYESGSGPGYRSVDYFVGAKNTLCVSASSAAQAGPPKQDGIAYFSAYGPMNDGRVKPDVVAKGDNVTLDWGSNGVQTMSGTSFSTPAVTGVLAQIFEYYKSKAGTEPSAALAKALICNSAADLGPAGPDAVYGFGIVDAKAAIDTIGLRQSASVGPFYEGSVSNGEQQTFTVSVVSGTAGMQLSEMKLTLCWMDAGGNPAAAKALVNDLDLEVRSPGGTVYYPFSLDAANPSAAASATGPNTADPIEQTRVANPEAGDWTVVIKGGNVPSGPQSFAVCVNLAKTASPLTAVLQASPVRGPAPLGVSFTGDGSLGSITGYIWNFGDGTPSASGSNAYHTYTVKGTYTATLTVSKGSVQSTDSTVIIADKANVEAFASKAAGRLNFKFQGRDRIQFALTVPDLVMTAQQTRDAIKDNVFRGQDYTLTLGSSVIGVYTLTSKASFRSKTASLVLNPRLGRLTVTLTDEPLLKSIFAQAGMTSAANSSGLYSLPVQLETEGTVYRAAFNLEYKNPRGTTATAKSK